MMIVRHGDTVDNDTETNGVIMMMAMMIILGYLEHITERENKCVAKYCDSDDITALVYHY